MEKEDKRLDSIECIYNKDTGMYVVSSSTVPGLVAENETMNGLIKEIKIMIPKLLDIKSPSGCEDMHFKLIIRMSEADRSNRVTYESKTDKFYGRS